MTILHNFIDSSAEDYNESNRKVLLHQHADGYATSFTTATMAGHYVQITRMDEDRKPKTMRLTSVEVEALIAAWTQFKADIETAKAAKIAQEQTNLHSALSLARAMREHLGELGTLEIKVNHSDHDHDTYKVSLPSLSWDYYSHRGTGYTIHTGTILLEAVRKALSQISMRVEELKRSSARPMWQGEDKEKLEGYIATWDAAQPWLEQVKAEHFPKTTEQEEASETSLPFLSNTVPSKTTVTFTVTGDAANKMGWQVQQ